MLTLERREKLATRHNEVVLLPTHTPVTSTPEDITSGTEQFIYVTEVWDESNPVPLGILHTVRRAVTYGDHWLVYIDQTSGGPGSENTVEARGALINPSIQEGQLYRAFTLDDGESFLLRGRADGMRLDILSDGYGKDWTYENDSTSVAMLQHGDMLYVKVLEAPTAEGGRAADPSADKFRGYADLEAGLNPALHPGQLYVVQSDGASTAEVFVGLCQSDGSLRQVGLIHPASGWVTVTSMEMPELDPADAQWALLRLDGPEGVGLTAAITEDTQEVDAKTMHILQATSTMNDVMNEIASEAGWCNVYEETIIHPFGLTPREEEDPERDWTLTVSGTVEVRDSSPSAELDETLTNWYFPGIVTSELTFETKFEVRLLMSGYTSASDAEEALTESEVADELRATMSGGRSVTFHSMDYEIDRTEEGDTLDD